jgi:hypothetical protein
VGFDFGVLRFAKPLDKGLRVNNISNLFFHSVVPLTMKIMWF